MRILHVVRGMANSSGTTHIVRALSQHQARLGHQVHVLCVERRNEEAALPVEQNLEAESLHASGLFWQRFRLLKNFGYSRPFRRRMEHVLKNTDIVHVHAVWNYPTYCAMSLAARYRVPYVVSPQGSFETWALGQSQQLKEMYGRYFEKPLYDRAAAMVVLTDNEAQQCREFGITSPVRIMPNGVDCPSDTGNEDRIQRRRAEGISEDHLVILFLSRLHPKKGVDILIRAVANLPKELPLHVWIAGHDAHGSYDRELYDLVSKCGLQERVRFLGEVRGARKFELMRMADLFVLPSHSEGMPMAVLEAMSCGTPVLITPGCNLPEVAASNAGWIVPAEDAAWAVKLSQILEQPKQLLEFGKRAQALIHSHFEWSSIAKASLDIYQLALDAKNGNVDHETSRGGGKA